MEHSAALKHAKDILTTTTTIKYYPASCCKRTLCLSKQWKWQHSIHGL
jgi:hypothetical protein